MLRDMFQDMLDKHTELDKAYKAILIERNTFHNDVKKALIEKNAYQALTINWGAIKRLAR